MSALIKSVSVTPGNKKLGRVPVHVPASTAPTSSDLFRAKEIIQKELFNTERLVSCVSVSKTKETKKKKQQTFLCVTVTSEKPVICKIHTVKKTEKGDGFKKKASWELADLKSVDGRCVEGDENGQSAVDFDIVLDKVYKWRADKFSDRDDLIQVLWKLSRRHLPTQPTFENVGKGIKTASLPLGLADGQAADDDTSIDPLSDLAYQVISSKEESDIDQLIIDSEMAISDAHKFADKLTADLSLLDGANVRSLDSSEDHVLQLMQLIDEAIKEVTQIEDRLTDYDRVIMVVKEEMERMKDKDDLMKIQESNRDRLIESLESLITNLDLPTCHQRALTDKDLASPSGIKECTEAALALQKCVNTVIEPALLNMDAVRDQKDKLSKLSRKFSRKLSHHLNNLFVHKEPEGKINTLQGTLRSGELRIQTHQKQHRELLPYKALMLWLKMEDPAGFHALQNTYAQSLSKIYEREIRDFLEAVKLRVGHKESRHIPGLSVKHSAGSTESLQSIDPRQQSADKQSRQAFNKMVERAFAELSPICMSEQDFCTEFFHISQDVPEGDEQDGLGRWVEIEEELADDIDDDDEEACYLVRTHLNNETRLLMSDIFSSLDTDLSSFINHCIKQDTFYSLSLLVHLSHHTNAATNAGSFLSKVYGTAVVSAKRNFDEYIKLLCRSFEETKPTKKSRCGIIPFVHTFEEFAEQSENIFHNSDRRSDLDKAYKVLAQCLFNEVARISSDHVKTPRHVIMFENFHRINAVLSRMKIACLEAERKDARVRYNDYMQAYVQEQLGRPMEKLTLFFEGVDEKLKSGVKAEEVGYLLAFNKQELRKVIKEYPAKEVRKGLEALYKKLEKHVSDDENLLQVVWTSMQREFLNQYNLFVSMLAKCYAASNISLEFSIENVLQMFSDIAQAH